MTAIPEPVPYYLSFYEAVIYSDLEHLQLRQLLAYWHIGRKRISIRKLDLHLGEMRAARVERRRANYQQFDEGLEWL